MSKRRIVWATQPLGQMPDRELAERLGVPASQVGAARWRLRIPRHGCSKLGRHPGAYVAWHTQPLGQIPDRELAKRLGLPTRTVAAHRRRLGIAPVRTPGIDWSAQPLGQVVDRELAERLGVATATVAAARRRLGIAARRKWSHSVWDDRGLGTMPDAQLAEKLGVSRQAVHDARKRHGVPRYTPPRVTDADRAALADVDTMLRKTDALLEQIREDYGV